jgi:dTDP-4-dehydrorhamnose reductase
MPCRDAGTRLGWDIRVADAAIVPIPTTDYPTPAARPLNSRLDTRKLRDRLRSAPAALAAGRRMLAEIL